MESKQYIPKYIDDYRNLGIDASNAADYTIDGIHLNEEGRSLLASSLAEFVQEITGADLFKAEPEVPYAKDYNACKNRNYQL